MDEGGMLDTSAIPAGTLVRPAIEKILEADRPDIQKWLNKDGYLFFVVDYDSDIKWNICRSLATGNRRRFFAYELDTTEPNDA
jgi:hypothetical protein